MVKEALQYLLDQGVKLAQAQAEVKEKTIDGRLYVDKEYKAFQPPTVTPLLISTLGSLLDLCNSKFGQSDEPKYSIEPPTGYHFEKFDPKRHFLHVVSESRVGVFSSLGDEWERRECLVNCSMTETNLFKFNQWHNQDDFIIGLLASFVDSDDKPGLIKLAGNATSEQVSTLVDDGITQVVSMRAGAALQNTEAVKGLVKLAPWRTFREVDQPSSKFIFRIKQDGGNVKFALFEADGGKWKLDAIENIARFLSAGTKYTIVVS